MSMKKSGLFSKSGCDWRVIPGSNPSSKQKQDNPIYENETQFLREKSPQTLCVKDFWWKDIPDLQSSTFSEIVRCAHGEIIHVVNCEIFCCRRK